jgi:hypothetical protein
MVDAIVAQVLGEIAQPRLRRHDRDVRALSQLRDEVVQRPDVAAGRREEHVAMGDDVRGDRLRTADRIDFGAGTLERGDDPSKLVEVAGDREDTPLGQASTMISGPWSRDAAVAM